MPTAQLTRALHWRSAGPYSGGRVTTLAGIGSEPNVFFMGTAGGGVWETTNYGNTWRNISDRYFGPQTSGSVGAMAIAPSNHEIIYVGTGDSAPRNTVVTGHGMYKST
ncbi:MAG: WD40/YVTN/BNR-like repeat-containing protein, partial [Terriglobales bacterium]